MAEQAQYSYDLFISYAEADRAWVEGYLLDALTQAGVRCHSEATLGMAARWCFDMSLNSSKEGLSCLQWTTPTRW